MNTKTKLAIVVQGGVVQAIVSDMPATLDTLVDISIIDYDVDETNVTRIRQRDGSYEEATVSFPPIEPISINLDDVYG